MTICNSPYGCQWLVRFAKKYYQEIDIVMRKFERLNLESLKDIWILKLKSSFPTVAVVKFYIMTQSYLISTANDKKLHTLSSSKLETFSITFLCPRSYKQDQKTMRNFDLQLLCYFLLFFPVYFFTSSELKLVNDWY